jgi:hypothetical protein
MLKCLVWLTAFHVTLSNVDVPRIHACWGKARYPDTHLLRKPLYPLDTRVLGKRVPLTRVLGERM